MTHTYSPGICGTGACLPNHVVTNDELDEILRLGKGFIKNRTGILERRWTSRDENVITMAVEASAAAVQNADVKNIDCVLVCRDVILTKRALSISLPILERLDKEGIGVEGAYSIDFCNYCPSFLHALHMAELMVRHAEAENVLVVASTDYGDMICTDADFNASQHDSAIIEPLVQQYSIQKWYQHPKLNAFLWGCGAGAVVVGRTKDDGISRYQAAGSLKVRHNSYGIGETKSGKGFGSLDGQAIYKFAVEEVPGFLEAYMQSCGLWWGDIDFLLPHQPNPRILGELSKKLGLPDEKVLVSCDTLGNMIAASLPITYHLNLVNGKIKTGDTILLCSFGDSYLTVAAMILDVQ